MPRLFVYGSLKRGFSNAHLMHGARFVRACSTTTGYRLVRYQSGYPALVHSPLSGARVHGELYEVGADLLAQLDEFEGCPDLYQRELVLLQIDAAHVDIPHVDVPNVVTAHVDAAHVEAEAFAYVIDEHRAQRWEEVPHGTWSEGHAD